MTRILVCGGREYSDFTEVDRILTPYKSADLVIIHGGARGADRLAGQWASREMVAYRVFFADWDKHGKAAGPIRNQQMLDEGQPDLVIAFPGGRGTADMVRRAKKAGIEVIEPQ